MEVSDLKGAVRNERNIEILVDIRTSELTLSDVMQLIEDYRINHPDKEVWMDGDMYAIVSMDRKAMA